MSSARARSKTRSFRFRKRLDDVRGRVRLRSGGRRAQHRARQAHAPGGRRQHDPHHPRVPAGRAGPPVPVRPRRVRAHARRGGGADGPAEPVAPKRRRAQACAPPTSAPGWRRTRGRRGRRARPPRAPPEPGGFAVWSPAAFPRASFSFPGGAAITAGATKMTSSTSPSAAAPAAATPPMLCPRRRATRVALLFSFSFRDGSVGLTRLHLPRPRRSTSCSRTSRSPARRSPPRSRSRWLLRQVQHRASDGRVRPRRVPGEVARAFGETEPGRVVRHRRRAQALGERVERRALPRVRVRAEPVHARHDNTFIAVSRVAVSPLVVHAQAVD